MLSFRRVCAAYGKKQVLDQIDFELPPHTLTAVVGKNGSGKSTLFACAGRKIPYTGEITLSGRDLAAMTPRERAQRMAFLPQTLPAPAVSVAELAAFGRNPYLDFGRRMTPTDRRLVEEALERVGIAALRDKLLAELSGGERQKAYLAMILAQDTDVLLLDEPTTYMDMEYEAAFFRLLKALQAEKGVTLLVILHDLSQAMRYADRIVVLDGRPRPLCGGYAGLRGQRRSGSGVPRPAAADRRRRRGMDFFHARGISLAARPTQMPADWREKGRRTHQTPRQVRRGPARREAAPKQTVRYAAGRAARAGGRNASAGANSAAAARQARFSLNRRDRPHCGNGAFAGARIGGSRRRGFCGGLMRMRGVRPLKAGAPPFFARTRRCGADGRLLLRRYFRMR